jgi:fructose-1,6-bisphosphatase/inositol monophosphatase family enzyme
MNHASYTNFSQMCKARINKFLHLQKWALGHNIETAREKTKGDWVTFFDEEISNIIEKVMLELKLPHQLLSEENWNENSVFDYKNPIMILDPIDGTKGFKNGTHYFCLSLLAMEKGEPVYSWLWNFGTQEELNTFSPLPKTFDSSESPEKFKGLVSDSEWKRGLWLEASTAPGIDLQACGSIAYKLLLLANGKCHFVASKQPKNLWDIAGGIHTVAARGFKTYCQHQEVLTLDKMHWDAPLLWCKPEHFVLLRKKLFG